MKNPDEIDIGIQRIRSRWNIFGVVFLVIGFLAIGLSGRTDSIEFGGIFALVGVHLHYFMKEYDVWSHRKRATK